MKQQQRFIFALGDEIVWLWAWDKQDAYIRARMMGYNGKIEDIRMY